MKFIKSMCCKNILNAIYAILIVFCAYSFTTMQIFASEDQHNIHSNDEIILDLDLTEILKEQEVQNIYNNARVTGFNLETEEKYINDYYANGAVESKRKNKTWKGLWYTDKKGQHCIRWNHKDTANCELIGLDDDGNLVKIKDENITKEIKSFSDIPESTK